MVCCDPIEEESEINKEKFICFKCRQCQGCDTEVSFYGHWKDLSIRNHSILCCDECEEKYTEGKFCVVCLKTLENEEESSCLKCNSCNGFVHSTCEYGKNKEKEEEYHSKKRDRRSHRREDTIFENESFGSHADENEIHSNESGKDEKASSYECPDCRCKRLLSVLNQLKEIDVQYVFLHPITEEIAPDYFHIIPKEKVMCLDLIESRIQSHYYKKDQQFRNDFELMCYNAFLYNERGDEVWEYANKMFSQGESVLNSNLRYSIPSEYVNQIDQVKTEKENLTTRREASYGAKQASLEALKRVQIIERMKQADSKLNPCIPLPGPYSILNLPMTTQQILPNYLNTTALDMCLSCGSSGDRDSMLFCADCGECFHVFCVSASGTVTTEMRRGWRCPNCKICEICGLSLTSCLGNPEIVCSCTYCDRTFHKTCLHYTDENNLSLLVCGFCFKCVKCGVCGTPTTWSYHRKYCQACYAKEERFRRCAVCQQPWNASDVDMGFCESCEQWIHKRCLSQDLLEWQKCDLTRSPYHCKCCRSLQESISNEENGCGDIVREIQKVRQRLRVKELVQHDINQCVRIAQLEPLWREFVRTVIRVSMNVK